MEDSNIKESTRKYMEEVKNLLRYYKNNPDYRDEYYCRIFTRNKNKLLIAMLNLFDEEINNLTFDGKTDELTYLFSIIDLLPDVIDKNIIFQQTVTNRFNVVHREINDLLHKNEGSKNNRYKLLENLRNKIEDIILTYSNQLPIDYDPTKEDFISYLIFQEKNINYIENAIKEFPYIVNIKDKNDETLINRVLKVYLRAINKYTKEKNLGPLDDLIYYKKILTILIKSPKIALNEEDINEMIKKLSDHLSESNHDVLRQKEKHTYFVNSIIMLLLGQDEENDLENLNYEYEVHDTFKATHELEAKRIYVLNKHVDGKRKKKRIYTFDGEGAFELDDALSIENKDGIYHLGVHIADPLAYIPTDSILYDEAKKRTRSLYCGSECIPMYPFNLSGDIMSLNEGEYRHAMSHYFDIDASTGDLLKYEIKAEPIKVTKNLTYDKFNQDIEHGADDEAYMETLMNLCGVAPILGRVYNEDAVYQEFHGDNAKTIGTSVVEKCMIYTNYNLAKLFSDKGLPYIYRCHSVDEKQLKRIDELKSKITAFRSDNKYMLRDYEMLKSIFPRAYYTKDNKGHMGLGTTYYSHVTSPLRRLADNIAEECVYKFILGEYTQDDIKAYEEYIEQMAENINSKRRSLDNYEIERGKRLIKTNKES